MFVQLFVIRRGNEQRIIIKKMDLLLITHADVWMLTQKIMQRRRPGFLRTGKNEIEPVNCPTFRPK